MTTRDLIQWAGQHTVVLLLAFVAPPGLVWLAGRLHGKEKGKLAPWKYMLFRRRDEPRQAPPKFPGP